VVSSIALVRWSSRETRQSSSPVGRARVHPAHFYADQRGREGHDELVVQLQALEGRGMKWEPLRYQEGIGQGWESVAQNVADLRERLLGPCTQAAL
jgi:hypothetical protein